MLPTELFKVRLLRHLGLVCNLQVSPLPEAEAVTGSAGQNAGGKRFAAPGE